MTDRHATVSLPIVTDSTGTRCSSECPYCYGGGWTCRVYGMLGDRSDKRSTETHVRLAACIASETPPASACEPATAKCLRCRGSGTVLSWSSLTDERSCPACRGSGLAPEVKVTYSGPPVVTPARPIPPAACEPGIEGGRGLDAHAEIERLTAEVAQWKRATGYDDPELLDMFLGRSGIRMHIDIACARTDAAVYDRDKAIAALRTVAHEIGVCHCWDYGCEPGPTDAIVDAVKEMRRHESEAMEARSALDAARAANAALHRRVQRMESLTGYISALWHMAVGANVSAHIRLARNHVALIMDCVNMRSIALRALSDLGDERAKAWLRGER